MRTISHKTPTRFQWGDAKVERLFADDRGVTMRIESSRPRHGITITVTPTGILRVWKDGRELK